ncbi:CLUMA_CG001725, isoform A [Clunio marinus]|uniref:CLUMA_CG001725, isoform A n=1 Tax=Clunio marinus TaxID=568069 RepID=A0A1J1HJ50_9DIPT|nr:CLUMA_CG001725, isoform A [Clunio marinus]
MWSKVNYFLVNTSLNGFKYLAEDDRPAWKKILARIFWKLIIATAIYLMSSLLFETISQFKKDSTTINLNTNYYEWENNYPAISICMGKAQSTDGLQSHMIKYWKTMNMTTVAKYTYFKDMRALLFLSATDTFEKIGASNGICHKYNSTCGIDPEILRSILVTKKCEDFITEIKFRNKKYECDELFKFHITEIGYCFTANSLYFNEPENLKNFDTLPMKYFNLDLNNRKLEIHYTDHEIDSFNIFVHSPEENPDFAMTGHSLKKSGANSYYAYRTVEIENQPEVYDEVISARECRFPFEYLIDDELNIKLPYSISNCRFLERVKKEIEKCNCTLPIGILPDHLTRCNITRFQCAKACYESFKNPKECEVPSCLAMEVAEIGHYEMDSEDGFNKFVIEVLNNPTLKYVRRVKHTILDRTGRK